MSHTIKGFQEDKAVLLVDTIMKYDPTTLARVERVLSLFVKHSIFNDFTYWKNVEKVLADLGYDYDEIFEVISR